MNATETQARAILKRVGFDPVTILTLLPVVIQGIQYLISAFQKCRNPDPDPPTPQEYVQRRYNAKRNRYNPALLNHVIGTVEQAAKKQKQKLTAKQARDIAIATLDQTRTASNAVMGAVMVAADTGGAAMGSAGDSV